jgi:hypothetical protein
MAAAMAFTGIRSFPPKDFQDGTHGSARGAPAARRATAPEVDLWLEPGMHEAREQHRPGSTQRRIIN